ncbi:hypothetical protein SELMODRAFT_413714 [Selaginella moellendorffii]|uniref:RRM domain-containing protein n=1 Tax=Selaginella moellendorffii TaxID=88036 RepID=D8RPZ8_SELML|nr:heterogeneous nuclear ribonucleoprotein H3 [Selaginella moellendorffii]EFJ25570.1 hypothetical protein SELMODRAFT_413714 [Selaginella moellendorffii]|eukprot:XP_002973196.1 heterogeneous nuclear ribonucleoprotein H3 [Selaginella moellendorffii]
MFSRGNLLGSGGSADGYEVAAAKRQRLLDTAGSYFGSSPHATAAHASFMYGGPGFAFLGQPRPFPVVRLRGLPFNCSESDVFEFFAGLDVVDVLLVRKQGRFSGEAFVVLGAPMQVDFALQRNRQNMGRRYVEVFRSKKQDYYSAVATEVNDPRSGDVLATLASSAAGGGGGGGGSGGGGGGGGSSGKNSLCDKDLAEHTGVLKLRGLPFSASKRDIVEFFREFGLKEDSVQIVVHSDGRATGEAYVFFLGPGDSKAAMNKDKMTLGNRYVELFPSSREEANRAASKSR